MPRRNRTGPLGQGPMTGRGLGNCRVGLYPLDDKAQTLSKDEQKRVLMEEKEKIEQKLADLESNK